MIKRFLAVALLAASFIAWSAAPTVASDATPSPAPSGTGAIPSPQQSDHALAALLAKMTGVNPDLETYEAAIKVDVKMKTFPFLSPTLTGRVYWERPDRAAVVFDTLPALANQFKKVYPRIEAPSQWQSIYYVSLAGPDRVRLVPRKHGRIDHIDVTVNPDGTIGSMHWFYNDGGDVVMNQTFGNVQGRTLVTEQRGTVDLPSYKGDIQAAFTDYKVNVKLPASVFAS